MHRTQSLSEINQSIFKRFYFNFCKSFFNHFYRTDSYMKHGTNIRFSFENIARASIKLENKNKKLISKFSYVFLFC